MLSSHSRRFSAMGTLWPLASSSFLLEARSLLKGRKITHSYVNLSPLIRDHTQCIDLQIFYVLEGAVTFKVHRTSFLLATGGMFLVPRGMNLRDVPSLCARAYHHDSPGNMYYIQNVSDRDAKLFFAQARKVEAGEGSRSPSKSRTPMPRQESVDEEVSHARVPSKSTKKRA